jgi:hypothetical protein
VDGLKPRVELVGLVDVVVPVPSTVVVVLGAATDVEVAGATVVVVGKEGGGGRDGSGTSGKSGKSSWEQSIGTPVRPSTKLQYNSWQPVRVKLDSTTASTIADRRGALLRPDSSRPPLAVPPSKPFTWPRCRQGSRQAGDSGDGCLGSYPEAGPW